MRWKAGKVIGRGSIGEVMTAMNINTGMLFAVKRFKFSETNAVQSQAVKDL
jgi:hypothetical protein